MVHAYWLEFKLGSVARVASVFHMFKHAFKACFLVWHFLTTHIFFIWRLFIPLTFCLTYSYIQKHQYVVLFTCRTTCSQAYTPGQYEDWRVTSIEQSNLSLAQGSYKNWGGYIKGTISIPKLLSSHSLHPCSILSSLMIMIDDRIYINTVLSTYCGLSSFFVSVIPEDYFFISV